MGGNSRKTVSVIAFLAFLSILAGCTLFRQPPEEAPPTGADEVIGLTEVDGQHAVLLGDGRTFILDNLAEWEKYERRFGPTPEELEQAEPLRPASLPNSVDLRSYQTSIKTQWGGTCVQFAVTAAIEAQFRRIYSGILDLSERFGQLLQKMSHLTEENQPQASCRENQLGAWGGGSLYYQMKLFTKYRLPLEIFLPYDTIVDPNIDWKASRCAAGTDQRAMDDWNLDPDNLPQLALEHARFRAQEVRFCPAESLRDPAWYERRLADGYEVVFAVGLCGGDPIPGNGVWDPGTGSDCAGHAMLMVGYRHGDRVFIAKNSWGYNYDHGENGFTLMSYDWVTEGHVLAAGYVVSVSPDSPYPFLDHLFLGRWYLDHDGWQGVLDIYRWPGLFEPSALDGAEDRRVGTYWGPDGVARRVNGWIEGCQAEFWIDWDDPNLEYDELHGLRFQAYLFTWDHDTMAGLMEDNRDGRTYGFYAVKGDRLTGTGVSGEPRIESYLGRWEMNHDGWRGTLEFESFDIYEVVFQAYARLTGTYTPQGEEPLPVEAWVPLTDQQRIEFSISFDPNNPQPFVGRLFGHETGIMSGTTTWAGNEYGFIAVRQGAGQ